MNLARVSANGQVTVAIINAQKAFKGSAEDFGVKSDEEVQRLVDEVRYDKTNL